MCVWGGACVHVCVRIFHCCIITCVLCTITEQSVDHIIITLSLLCYTEAKSAVIRRMQSNLEGWEKQLQEICDKKEKNGQCVCPLHRPASTRLQSSHSYIWHSSSFTTEQTLSR